MDSDFIRRVCEIFGASAEAVIGGIGEVTARGLAKRGDHWVTDAYEQPGPKIRITVHGGIGQINLVAE